MNAIIHLSHHHFDNKQGENLQSVDDKISERLPRCEDRARDIPESGTVPLSLLGLLGFDQSVESVLVGLKAGAGLTETRLFQAHFWSGGDQASSLGLPAHGSSRHCSAVEFGLSPSSKKQ